MTLFEIIAIVNMICNLGVIPGVFMYIIKIERVITELKTMLKFCEHLNSMK